MITLWRVAVPDDRRGGESYTGTGVGAMITLWRCRTTGGGGGELYRNGSWGDDNAVAGAGRQEGESYTGTGVGEMITLWRVADDRRGGGGELYRNGSWGDGNAVAGGGAGRQEGSYTGTGVGEMITLWRVPDDRRGRAIQERE